MTLSQMESEALAAPQIVEKQFVANDYLLRALCARLRCYPPTFAMTIARGSSDNAATFAKYSLETQLGLVTASAAPSVLTLYRSNLQLKNSLVIALSQSGESPDIIEMLRMARLSGAITVAIVNHNASPLAKAAEYVIPLGAGDELAVAATKSYIATLSALIQLIAMMTQEPILLNAMSHLPSRLQAATQMDWQEAVNEYQHHDRTFVVGRGYGFPIAQEAALKFKETANIQAEAFSGAELLHGPMALVKQDFPLLVFAQQDASLQGMIDLANEMGNLGAKVLLATPNTNRLNTTASRLPLPNALHPLCDPLLIIQAFYMMIARLSRARGLNPDIPDNLSKITKTW